MEILLSRDIGVRFIEYDARLSSACQSLIHFVQGDDALVLDSKVAVYEVVEDLRSYLNSQNSQSKNLHLIAVRFAVEEEQRGTCCTLVVVRELLFRFHFLILTYVFVFL